MSRKIIKYRDNKIFNSNKRLMYAKIFSIILIISSVINMADITSLIKVVGPGGWAIFFSCLFLISFVIQFISIILLDMAHGGIYWYQLDKKRIKMDERQITMRNIVFEKSYFVICSLLLIIFLFFPFDFFKTAPSIAFVFLVFSLPNIIASWQKNA